jgi:hypothetical protein
VVQKVAVDSNFDSLDGKGCDVEPFGVGMILGVAGSSLPKKDDVGDNSCTFTLKSVRRQPDKGGRTSTCFGV